MSNRVAVVDYGLCNLDSVRRGVEECGGEPVLVAAGAELDHVDRIILPGVGSFAEAMRNLRDRRLDEAVDEQVRGRDIPFLGICLGMQLLATEGLEGGHTKGLDFIDGQVRRLHPTEVDQRIPHVGWNEVHYVAENPLFEGIPDGTDFYFVHSFHLACDASDAVAATTPYCGGFTSAVARDYIFGVQFHPEKSQRYGLQLLRNFLAL